MASKSYSVGSLTYYSLSGHPVLPFCAAPSPALGPRRLVTVSGAQRGRQEGKQRVFQTLSCLSLSHHIVPGELEALEPDIIGYQGASQSSVRSGNSSSNNNNNNEVIMTTMMTMTDCVPRQDHSRCFAYVNTFSPHQDPVLISTF